MGNNRNEAIIFRDLEELCKSSGYIHAIVYFSFRDNFYRIREDLTGDISIQSNTDKFLVRVEINTLIALALKGDFCTKQPSPEIMNSYINRTQQLLEELHSTFAQKQIEVVLSNLQQDINGIEPFEKGDFLREAIFYAPEQAYDFQFINFILKKYEKDNEWFKKNKGYSIEQAIKIVSAIPDIQSEKFSELQEGLNYIHPDKWTCLSIFQFNLDDLVKETKLEKSIIESFVSSFTFPNGLNINEFSALDDFNPINAYPIIKLKDNSYLLVQAYFLAQALYETPFYWFNSDQEYSKNQLSKNRGEFTEDFSAERLKKVFGCNNVFTNINILQGKKVVAEIDVLAVFANRAIVVQAKAKRLTIDSRKGNDNSLKNDFKKAIQDAYDQAYLCSEYLTDTNYKLLDSNRVELAITRDFKEIYPVCIVSDSYPSLSAQAKAFLKYKTSPTIMPPFIMDVFFLDILTEILDSPLYFLSYLNRRVNYTDRVFAMNEISLLGFHLKENLWLDDIEGKITIGEDFSEVVDHFMMSRRGRLPHFENITPAILTRFNGTFLEEFLKEIVNVEDKTAIDLGFLLLQLGSQAVDDLNTGLLTILDKTKLDGRLHDLTYLFGDCKPGLTIHCNKLLDKVALEKQCRNNKYIAKADKWYGLIVDPDTSSVSYYMCLDPSWVYDPKMETMSRYIKSRRISKAQNTKTGKIGRNELCPCGSGKKYKKCCLDL